MKNDIRKIGTSYYIFIKTIPGKTTEVLEKVKRVHEVEEAHRVSGVYDIIAFLETKSLKELSDVISKIQDSKGVTATQTSIVIE